MVVEHLRREVALPLGRPEQVTPAIERTIEVVEGAGCRFDGECPRIREPRRE
jgi:hypothetical protein